jgi:hypothetical protein
MSGTSTTQYRNQLANSTNPKKMDMNASLEMKAVTGDASKTKYDYNRSYKLPYQVSPKVSVGNPNELVYNNYTHSSSYQVETNEKGGSRFGNGGGNGTTRESASG